GILRVHSDSRNQQVRRVLLITLVLNLVVAAGKIVIGLMTGALAITADGLHSVIDSSGNIVGMIAMRVASQPPDDDHPYGHARYETLAALAIGTMLLLTAWEIIQGALERLSGGEPPQITPLAFGVMIATLVINVGVNRYQVRQGRRLESQILLADAANTGADVFVTLSVLASMVLVVAFGWHWADVAAALLVTILIGRAALKILRQTGRVLVDTAPYKPEELAEQVLEVPAVENVLRARSRGSADAAYIDIDVQVAPEMTAGQTAAIGEAIRSHLQQHLSGIQEIEIHFAPDSAREQNYALAARAQADALALTTHEVVVSDSPRGKMLEMHVEVPPGQTLAVAHQKVSQLERAVKEALPDIADVITHIEPALDDTTNPVRDTGVITQSARITALVRQVLGREYPDLDWHHFNVYPLQEGFGVSMHVTLPPQMTVEAAHRVAENTEMLLRVNVPLVERVTIHTEPPEYVDERLPG
ncbi:MAG: cation-efflux pump, partial [Anaerolineae bacterium]|nr:cation-efflux pump [Anaerolineae bacterium]